MYKHIPFNERKQNANNFQTILLKNKQFLNIAGNELDDRNNERKLSSGDIRIKLPSRRLTKIDAKLNTIKSNKSLNKIVESKENDFNNWNEEEKENFLKNRGRKLKDYLHGFLNKNENINPNDEEGENPMQLFSLDYILEKKEEDLKDSNIIFDFHLKNLKNFHNEKRSRTSGPAHFNFGKSYKNNPDSSFISKIEMDKIMQETNKNRKHTISYNNEHVKSKRKTSLHSILESYISVPKIERKNKTIINNIVQSNQEKTLKSNDSKNILNEIQKERSSKHSNSIHRKSVMSIKEYPNDDKKPTRKDINYLTILNKKLSDNKLAFKNFSKVGKEEEKNPSILINQVKRNFIKFDNVYDSLSDEENEDYSSCLIYPESKFKGIWDYIILLITVYTLLYVPYDMAYIDSNSLLIMIIDLVCDIIYMIDVILQFFMPISTNEDKYITSYDLIAKNYILTWFLLDVTSSLPFNSIVNLMSASYKYSEKSKSANISDNITNIAKLSRVYRMMRLIRLLKLIKIAKSDKYKTKNLNIFRNNHISNINRLFLFLLYFIIFNHMLACIWTFVGLLDYPNWISNENMLDSSNLDLYIASIYFNLTTIFTIGYGDIKSKNNYERMYNIIIMCVGIMLYTFAVSSLSNLYQKRDEKTLKFQKNINFLDDVSVRFNLSHKLYAKIRRCLKYDYSVNTEDKFNMLSNLPEIIKIELINQMHKEMIHNFFFFKNTNSAFRAKILIMLKPLKAIRGDILIKENEFVEEMFFIKKGILNVCKNYRGQPLKLIEIRKNEHFGEIFMLLHEKSLYDLIVKSKYVELFFLRKVDLLEVYGEYQSIFESILQKSTYNSLIILKRYKNMLRNIKKRKSAGKTKTESINNSEARKSMFIKFLKKDEEKNLRDKNKRNSIFYTKGSPQKKNTIDINSGLVNQIPILLTPQSTSFKKDFPAIIENEEENEDDIKVNSPRFNDNNFVRKNEREKSKKKIIEIESSESDSIRKRKFSNNLDVNLSLELPQNANSLRSTNIRNSISDKLKISILPVKNPNDILTENRNEKRRFTGLVNPSKTINLNQLQEIKNNLEIQKKKPLIAKRNNHNSSLNIQIKDKYIRRNTLFIHNEINKNIISDSLNIKAPAMFYSNKFEKWTLLCQIRKLDNIFNKFQNELDLE